MDESKNKTRKYSDKSLAFKQNEKIETKLCLCCNKKFKSFHKYNKLCDPCKRSEKFESTYI